MFVGRRRLPKFKKIIQIGKLELVWLIHSKEKGEPCWHYIEVEKNKLRDFKEKLKTGSMELTEYGKVVFSGWGQEPSAEIQEKVAQMYKVDD